MAPETPPTGDGRHWQRFEETQNLAANGVSGVAVNRRLQAVRSCAEAHGEPDFDNSVLVEKVHKLSVGFAGLLDR